MVFYVVNKGFSYFLSAVLRWFMAFVGGFFMVIVAVDFATLALVFDPQSCDLGGRGRRFARVGN